MFTWVLSNLVKVPTYTSMTLCWIVIDKTSPKNKNFSYQMRTDNSADLRTANITLIRRMQSILFATQSYFHMEIKPYCFMMCSFVHEVFIMKSRKKLRNTVIISSNFKHNQSHRTVIWGRNLLEQNNTLIESLQVMENVLYLITLIPIKWPTSCSSK